MRVGTGNVSTVAEPSIHCQHCLYTYRQQQLPLLLGLEQYARSTQPSTLCGMVK